TVPLRGRAAATDRDRARAAGRLPRRQARAVRIFAFPEAVLQPVSATNFFTGNADLVEVFDKVIPWDRVVGAVEGPSGDVAGAVSTWREVLDLAGKYIATEIAPRAAEVDEIGVIRDNGQVRMNEPMLKNLRGLAELGLASPSVPADFGGAGLPFTVTMMIGEMLARADL